MVRGAAVRKEEREDDSSEDEGTLKYKGRTYDRQGRVVERESEDGEERSLSYKGKKYGLEGKEKIDEHAYKAFAHQVLSYVPGEQQQAIAQVLNNKKAREMYGIMKKEGMSLSSMRRMMIHGAENIARGEDISVAAYARAVAEELTNDEKYRRVVKEMYDEGVISKEVYKEMDKHVGKHERGAAVRYSNLEKAAKAAVWLILVLGVVVMFASGLFTTTGAVTGVVTGGASAMFIVGFAMFCVGLYLLKSWLR